MIVRAVGGLCNRLGAILSLPRPLVVIWPINDSISYAHFRDVFEPIDGIDFVHGGPCDREAFNPQPEAAPGWEKAFLELHLVHEARVMLTRATGGAATYAAIHVRRTDADPDAKEMGLHTPDDGFLRFVTALPPGMPVYVATDNRETQTRWRDILGARALMAGPARESSEAQARGDQRRHTSLQHAAVDLFACAAAKYFNGSGGSSFTDTIVRMRSVR